MGRFANKYISNINKNIETNRNQVGWEMRTKDNLGEFRYKNDQFELVYDDKSVLVLNAGGIVITENYTVNSTNAYTIEAGDNIIFNSTNNINMTSVENINITSGDTINIISEETVNINSTENITFTSDDSVLTWDGDRLTTDTETVAYLTDLPIIDANTTIQGNTFNGINQLVQLDGSGYLPAINGSQLTNLPLNGGGTVQNINLSVQATDEGTVTGDTRGISSVDLQTNRSSSDQVVSGDYSISSGGRNSKISGDYSGDIGSYTTITKDSSYSIGLGGTATTNGELILSSSNSPVQKSIFILEGTSASTSPVLLQSLGRNTLGLTPESVTLANNTSFCGTMRLSCSEDNGVGLGAYLSVQNIMITCDNSGTITYVEETPLSFYGTILGASGSLTFNTGTSNTLLVYVTSGRSDPAKWVCIIEGIIIDR